MSEPRLWNLSDFYVNMNSFGNIYRLTSFGESHGRAVGGVIDGMPPRKVIDLRQLQSQEKTWAVAVDIGTQRIRPAADSVGCDGI